MRRGITDAWPATQAGAGTGPGDSGGVSGSVGNVGDVVDHRDHAPAAAAAELHGARSLGVDRVVAADADALAGLEAGAALADDDLAAGHGLPGEDLDAEALGVGVTAVTAGAEALLMRHRWPPSEQLVRCRIRRRGRAWRSVRST